jgi:hypothetical protein
MFGHLKLGLREHDPKRVSRVVMLTLENAPVDPMVSRTPKDWAVGRAWDDDVLGNDILGDCGPAACVNWLKMMATACGRERMEFTYDDARTAYRALGWDGTDATDQGVVLLDLMEYWTRHPIGGFQLDCFFSIGFADAEHLSTAVQFAPLIIGAELTTDCKHSDMWGAPEADGPQVWGGHAYLYHSDSPGGGNGKSWGQPVYTTPSFRARRWRECYLPICRELMPAGVDSQRLLAIAKGL